MDLFWDTYRAYLRSYLPQWRCAQDGGEPENAVLRAAVELIEASGVLMAGLPQKHELAFLSGWELEPLEAEPACACAALTAPEGGPVPAGTELYISGDGARLWRTVEDAQAEPARLTEQFLTGKGKRIPLPLPSPPLSLPFRNSLSASLISTGRGCRVRSSNFPIQTPFPPKGAVKSN